MRFLRRIVLTFAALVFLFEAWLWDLLISYWRWLASRLPVERLRSLLVHQVEKLPPYGALLLFALPGISILPFKIGGLWLMARGYFILGGATFLAAKIVGMAFAAFLFELTRPKLMTLAWFAKFYAWVMRARDWAHALTDPYTKTIKAEIRRLHALVATRRNGLLRTAARMRDRIRRNRSAS
ncbi:MAG: hypothetical protein AB7F96_21430 [Beijerinckiaceae bacterium]